MSNNEWRTPPEVFDPLNAEFGFTIDLAATRENHLLPRYCTKDGFYTPHSSTGFQPGFDGLRRAGWGSGEALWCNPPYSDGLVGQFVERCAQHGKAGGLAVMLLNATTTDTRWFHRFIYDPKMWRPRERVEVRLLPKRIAFIDENGVQQKSPRHSNMIVVFHPWDVAA